MPTRIDTLWAERAQLLTEAEGLLERSDTALEGDELARFTAIRTEVEGLDTKIGQLQFVTRAANHDGSLERVDMTDSGRGSGPTLWRRNGDPYLETRAIVTSDDVDDIRARALTAVEQTCHVPTATLESATAMIDRDETGRMAKYVLGTSRPELLRAATKYLRYGPRADTVWTDAERTALGEAQELCRALQITNDASGGYLMPFALDPTVILTNNGTSNPWRQIAEVVQISGDNWQGVTSAGVTSRWAAEASEANDDSPVFGQPTIKVHRADSFVPASIEAVEDFPSLVQDLSRLFADSKDRLESAAFTTGDGNGKPYGVVTRVAATPASVVASAGSDVFQLTDLYRLFASLPDRYRMNARWVAHLSVINAVRQFDTAGGAALLAYLGEGTPVQLLGRPLHESSDMDGTINAGAENYFALFGDFGGYRIVDRIGFSVEVIPHLFGTTNNRPTGQRGFFAYWRTGADVVDTNSFRLLNVT